MEKRSVVSVVSVTDQVQTAVRDAMTLAGFEKHLERGKPISFKVNLGGGRFIPGPIPSPWVLEGVIQTLKEFAGPLYLVESDQVLENIELAYRKCKLQEICDRY